LIRISRGGGFRASDSFSTAKKSHQTKWLGTTLNICKITRRAKYKDVLYKKPLATNVLNRNFKGTRAMAEPPKIEIGRADAFDLASTQ
jgi:hypothetical protein